MSNVDEKKERQIVKEIMKEKDEKEVKGSSYVGNLVSQMWKEAKAKGYNSLKAYIAHHYKTWDETVEVSLVDELYESFLEAVQRGELHKEEDKFWSFKSSFEDWLIKSRDNLHHRLVELDEDYETKQPSFAGYVDLFPDMKDIQGDVGNAIDPEDYDFYHMLMRKTIETIDKLLKNSTLIDGFLRKRDDIFKDGKADD